MINLGVEITYPQPSICSKFSGNPFFNFSIMERTKESQSSIFDENRWSSAKKQRIFMTWISKKK